MLNKNLISELYEHSIENDKFDKFKFAEMIITECKVLILANTPYFDYAENNLYHVGYDTAMNDCINLIDTFFFMETNEHFHS